jgi:hypothetical protein
MQQDNQETWVYVDMYGWLCEKKMLAVMMYGQPSLFIHPIYVEHYCAVSSTTHTDKPPIIQTSMHDAACMVSCMPASVYQVSCSTSPLPHQHMDAALGLLSDYSDHNQHQQHNERLGSIYESKFKQSLTLLHSFETCLPAFY